MAVQFQKRHFNVDEYYRMAEVGILTEDDNVELIEGEIIYKHPIDSSFTTGTNPHPQTAISNKSARLMSSHHAGCVKRLNARLNRGVGKIAIVSVQDPIRINDFSEPEPDIALLKPRA